MLSAIKNPNKNSSAKSLFLAFIIEEILSAKKIAYSSRKVILQFSHSINLEKNSLMQIFHDKCL